MKKGIPENGTVVASFDDFAGATPSCEKEKQKSFVETC